MHDIGAREGSPFVVMELLEGESLREKLKGGPLPVRKAIDYAAHASTKLRVRGAFLAALDAAIEAELNGLRQFHWRSSR